MTNSPQQAAFLLVDPRGDAFPLFAGLPHLGRPIIQTPDEAIKVLQALVWLMEQRAGVSNPHVIVVIDNLVDLLVSGCDAIRDPMARLLQRGHEAGIHVVAATQKPTADAVLFNNFPVRIVGKINDANEARVASGWNGTGAERLREQGEFIALAEGRLTRFQAAHVTAGEISDTIDGLRGEGFGGPGGPGLLAPSVSPLREGNVVALLRRQPQQPRRSQRALLEELGW
jgi:S-DNA-T family DNA segregation ATPase FtsK/SpoIIIE